ncbi:30S ribosomal protein S10 [Candidatus Micrarchaeota archaeon CG_4_10_14_0_2_um_filter_55_9]|nr:MAG: 30S ribosomal protein S10 [Candidatus Micrarchaeota archaeon CG1_02_55_41]PIO02940.1 MAG: 30S ribosomal protein S10 [Candidatus Micrarchaeota archaeon CG09_land_8_20_14_0_10_55_25]PIZ91525.1 MAG: 30S ribosomal protein S10 [Candidatus Micrarchaeota archaeon CG_4_10_14_0_2_um_filter_55_9]PJD01137.1 MAG: 30S ribosomal protein S10 [Candidatus Micrarchaeota archaeon CG10_big_fil_rev_8_21_14_0_10_54_18]
MNKARIKLESQDRQALDEVCNQIKSIAVKAGIQMKGPIPLPTKKMKVTTRKTPCGDGSDTYEKWELRVHKRLIEVKADDRVLREVMRIRIPPTVNVEMSLS